MRLTIYGRDVVIKMLVVTLLLDVMAILIPELIIKIVLLSVSVILISFTLYFFRDPIRMLPEDYRDNMILSPADGKVMMIENVFEKTYLNSKAKLIAIFLSPLDVHVNRIPVSGRVDFIRYVKGDYIVAFDHKSSERNERTEIGITGKSFKVLFKQIAGFVARRIVYDVKHDNYVKAGEKFGMIKFGSRMDVLLPEDSVVKVNLHQKVRAGETILAELQVKENLQE